MDDFGPQWAHYSCPGDSFRLLKWYKSPSGARERQVLHLVTFFWTLPTLNGCSSAPNGWNDLTFTFWQISKRGTLLPLLFLFSGFPCFHFPMTKNGIYLSSSLEAFLKLSWSSQESLREERVLRGLQKVFFRNYSKQSLKEHNRAKESKRGFF